MTGTMAFAIGLATGVVGATVTVLVTLGRAGRAIVARRQAKILEAMKDWETRQARGRAIMKWDDNFPQDDDGVLHLLANDDAQAAEFLLDAIAPRRSHRVDDTPRDGLDTWGFVG